MCRKIKTSRKFGFISGYGGTGRRAGLRILWETVQVRFLLSAPKKRWVFPSLFWCEGIEPRFAVFAEGLPFRGFGKFLLSAPKNDKFQTCRFFIHCESNGISSRVSVYIIAVRRISSADRLYNFRNDDIQGFALMIYKTSF